MLNLVNLLWEDVIQTYALRGNVLRDVRDHPQRMFFKDLHEHDPATVGAIESNYLFLLEMTATMAAEPQIPSHGIWKAGSMWFLYQFTRSLQVWLCA